MRINKSEAILLDRKLLQGFQAHLTQRDVSPRTIACYLHDLGMFLDWFEQIHGTAQVAAEAIRTVDLAAFRKSLIQERSLRSATVNRRIQSFRTFFGWLEQEGVITTNPAIDLRFVRRTPRKQPGSLQPKEVLALLRVAADSPHGLARRNMALLQLMLQTGMRLGEVAALEFRDLTLRERTGSVRIRQAKGLKEREVPLNVSARKALQEYLDSRNSPLAPSEVIFCSKRKKVLSIRGIQQVISDLAAKAKIRRLKVSAHTLRHTFSVNYLKNNPGRLVELAALLGHESLDTTAIYLRPSDEDLAADLERSPLNVLGE